MTSCILLSNFVIKSSIISFLTIYLMADMKRLEKLEKEKFSTLILLQFPVSKQHELTEVIVSRA